MKHSCDILGVDRPVIALQDEYPAGFIDPMHAHEHIQILYASIGVMSVTTRQTNFVIPPQRALWLAAGTEHEVSCRGPVSLRTLYLRTKQLHPALGCRVFEVSNLVKALILEITNFKNLYEIDGREGKIIRLLLDEVDQMPSAPYCVTMPQDRRLLRVCRELIANPSDTRDIDDWASIAAMGRRTFTRTFKQETGMGFAIWRQQVRLMEALSLLASGESVTQVAFSVGYDSPSGFSAMFRRAFGVPPSHYLFNESA